MHWKFYQNSKPVYLRACGFIFFSVSLVHLLFPRHNNSPCTLFIYLFPEVLCFLLLPFNSKHNEYIVVNWNMVFPNNVWKQWIPRVSCLNSSSDKPENLWMWKGFLIIIFTLMSGFSLRQRMVWSCIWLKRVYKSTCPSYVHIYYDCAASDTLKSAFVASP